MDTVIGYKLSICIAIFFTTVCFPDVYGQGTPVLTITPSQITVGDGDQAAELRCQMDKVTGYTTLIFSIQRQQADLSYGTIATINFQAPGSATVNDVPLQSRASATKNDPTDTSATFFAGSLLIRDVICTDAALYRCQAYVLDTSAISYSNYNSTGVELETTKLPSENPILSYSPSEINAGDAGMAGDDVQFACNGNVGRRRPPQELTIGVSIGSLSLELLTLTGGEDLSLDVDNCTQNRRVTAGRAFTRDEAKLGVIAQCNVANYPSLVHQLTLDIKYHVGDVEVTIDNSNSQRREISEGTRITVRCTSQANPIANHKIIFIRDGETAVTEEWARSSQVIQLMKTDAGLYFCEGSNRLSTGNFTDSSQYNITLTVTDPPLTEAPTTPTSTEPTKSTAKQGGSTDDPDEDNTGMIVGIVVGVVLAIIIIGVIIFIVMRRRGAKKQYLDEPSEKPRNNQDIRHVTHAPDLVSNGNNKPSPPPPYDNPQAFDRGNPNLHYADLAFDDRPRSRRPVAISDSTSPYAEVQLPRV